MNSSQPERGRALGFVGVGLQFSATVVLLTLLGVQVDRWLHSKPAFLLIGLLLGLATATWDILRQVQRFDRKRPPR